LNYYFVYLEQVVIHYFEYSHFEFQFKLVFVIVIVVMAIFIAYLVYFVEYFLFSMYL